MPFPTTGILDDFNRSDEGPPPSASWDAFGVDGVKVVSNQLAADTSAGTGYWLTGFAADSEVYCTIPTLQNDGNNIVLFIRTDATASTGYALVITRDDAGDDTVTILGPLGTVDSAIITLAAGDGFGLRAVDSNLTVWQKPAAGSWTEIITATDSEELSGGFIGLAFADTTARIDDFGGGDFVPVEASIVVYDALFFTEVDPVIPLLVEGDDLTLTDSVSQPVTDTMTLTDDLAIAVDTLTITDTLTFIETLTLDGPPVTPPDDAPTGGVDTETRTVLRFLYGNDKRNPLRVLDLAQSMSDGSILLKVPAGFKPASGELNELWTNESIRVDGQKKLAESRKNSTLALEHVLKTGGSQAALGYFMRKITRFFTEIRAHRTIGGLHKVWLEYRWSDGLNNLPTPTFGQLSGYYEVFAAKTPKWPDELHNHFDDLGQGIIDGVTCELTASPAPEGLKQRAAEAAGAVSLHAKGVLVASGSSSKLHWANYENSGLTGNFAITGWITLNATWSSGVKDIFDYYVAADNRIRIQYDRDNTRWVITKIVGGVTFTDTSASDTLASGDDVHLILVQDDTTLRLYVNGIEACSITATNTMTDGGLIAIGCPGTGTIDGVDLILDGWRILPYAATESLTADEAEALFDAELPIKQDGGAVGPPPYLWTKDGDSAVDNADDSGRDNWAVLAGVGGDLEAKVQIKVTIGTAGARRFYVGLKAADGEFDPSDYLWLETSTGTDTADSPSSGGSYRAKTGTSLFQSANAAGTDIGVILGRYLMLHRIKTTGAITLTPEWTIFDATIRNQNTPREITNTAFRVLELGDIFANVDGLDYEVADNFSLRATCAGAVSRTVGGDFFFLLPWPYVAAVNDNAWDTLQVEAIQIEEGQAYSISGGDKIDDFEYRGGIIRAVPDKYNYLFLLQVMTDDLDFDVTETATLQVHVTPRYLLPGGMVA